ncbi:hypothetical protein Peur_043131 [Populus x canadensis]
MLSKIRRVVARMLDWISVTGGLDAFSRRQPPSVQDPPHEKLDATNGQRNDRKPFLHAIGTPQMIRHYKSTANCIKALKSLGKRIYTLGTKTDPQW